MKRWFPESGEPVTNVTMSNRVGISAHINTTARYGW